MPLQLGQTVQIAPLSATELQAFRNYIASCKYCTTYVINDAMEKLIQQDFVQSRKMDKNVNDQHLHRWLNVARLLTLSLGMTEVNEQVWQHAKSLVAARK